MKNTAEPENNENPGRERTAAYVLLFFGALIVLAIYLPLINADFYYDDHQHLQVNPAVAGDDIRFILEYNFWGQSRGVDTNWAYRPLTSLLNRVIFQLSNTPAAMRLVSIVLHLLLGGLIFNLFRPWTGAFAAAMMTGLFWVHPIQTEAVFFAVGHAEMLGLLAMLLVWLAYYRGYRIVSWLLFALGLFAKESVALIYPVLAIHAVVTGRWKTVKAFFVQSVPYGLISVANLWIHYVISGKWSYHIGTLVNPLVDEPFAVRLANLLAMPGWYLFHLLVPTKIPADYCAGSFFPDGVVWTEVAGGILATVILVALLVVFWRKRGELRLVAVGIGLYLILGSMAFQWLGIGTFVLPDRLMYVPMIGLMLSLSVLLNRAVKPLVSLGLSRNLTYSLCGLLIFVPMVYFLPKAASAYASPERLGRSWLENSPGGARAYFMLANEACEKKDFPAAEQLFYKALSRYPDYVMAKTGLAKALSEQNKNKEARAVFEQVYRNNPDQSDTAYSYGAFLWQIGALEEALVVFSKAAERWPLAYGTVLQYGRLLDAMGRPEEGLPVIERACRLVNNSADCLREAVETRQNLFFKLFRQKRFSEVRDELSRADALPLPPESIETIRKKLEESQKSDDSSGAEK